MKVHVLKEGESLSSIAQTYGLSTQEIWKHPANDELRQRRKTPHILRVGDEVRIPEEGGVATRAKSGQPATLHLPAENVQRVRLCLRDALEMPLASVEYHLTLPSGEEAKGVTSSEGNLEFTAPQGTTQATISFLGLSYELKIGSLDPCAYLTGAQQRLANMGFYSGAIDGEFEARSKSALAAFQSRVGIPVSGILDDQTRVALEAFHEGIPRSMEMEETVPIERSPGYTVPDYIGSVGDVTPDPCDIEDAEID